MVAALAGGIRFQCREWNLSQKEWKMKAIVRYSPVNGFACEVEADGVKAAIKAMSEYMEVFGGHVCGKCQSKAVVCQHNQDKEGNDYYKLRCTHCGALLDFGQHKSGGTVFVKRKDKEGNWLPDNGWYKWQERSNRQTDDAPIQDTETYGF